MLSWGWKMGRAFTAQAASRARASLTTAVCSVLCLVTSF